MPAAELQQRIGASLDSCFSWTQLVVTNLMLTFKSNIEVACAAKSDDGHLKRRFTNNEAQRRGGSHLDKVSIRRNLTRERPRVLPRVRRHRNEKGAVRPVQVARFSDIKRSFASNIRDIVSSSQ